MVDDFRTTTCLFSPRLLDIKKRAKGNQENELSPNTGSTVHRESRNCPIKAEVGRITDYVIECRRCRRSTAAEVYTWTETRTPRRLTQPADDLAVCGGSHRPSRGRRDPAARPNTDSAAAKRSSCCTVYRCGRHSPGGAPVLPAKRSLVRRCRNAAEVAGCSWRRRARWERCPS